MRISDWSSDVCSSDLVDTINCGDVLDRKKAWASRWEWLEKMPTFASLSAVDAARLSDGVSLALLQPKRLLGLDISKADRKSVVKGKSVSVRVDLGGRRSIKNKTKQR